MSLFQGCPFHCTNSYEDYIVGVGNLEIYGGLSCSTHSCAENRVLIIAKRSSEVVYISALSEGVW